MGKQERPCYRDIDKAEAEVKTEIETEIEIEIEEQIIEHRLQKTDYRAQSTENRDQLRTDNR